MTALVTLHDYWRSSASYRVRIALNLAGIEYETVVVNLLEKDHRSDAYLKRNPQGLVPTLEIDGVELTQSLAIVEYLNDTRDLNLLPDDPKEQALVRATAMAIAVDIHPVYNLGVVSYATGGQEPARTDWMQHIIAPGLAAFEALISKFDGAFCCGDTLSLADICLMPQLYNAERWGVDYSTCPNILRAQEACNKLPAFQAAYPDEVNI